MADTTSAILAQRLSIIHDDVADIKLALRELTSAITKLAIIEERQAQVTSAVDRAFLSIERLSARVNTIEQKLPANDRAAQWVDRVTWAALGLFGMYIAKSIGIIS